jgi:hypothetical protein
MKKNKSSAVMEMLKKGLSVKEIRNRMSVSESYVYLAKKKLADMADEAITEAAAALKEACTFTPKPEPEVSGVDTVLDERESQYGSYMQSADTAIKIKSALHNAIARNDLHLYPDQLMSLDMIAVKLSRIANGNPAHRDSWIDIAGYATLVADRLQGKSR